MKIVYKLTFADRLESHIDYLAKYNVKSAKKFHSELIKRIKQISHNPYRYRKSVYFNDKSIRDLVFKGCTVVFRINNDVIEIFGFARYQENPVD